MFKIIHVPYTYYPDAVGGTEIYVEQLAEQLRAHEIQNVIVAPGRTRVSYTHGEIPIERLAVDNQIDDVHRLYGEGDHAAAHTFGEILDAHQPHLVHLHAFTRIVSPLLIDTAHARHIPVVFTYHTPTVSCLRSGLMRWGREVCDGVLEAERCTRCRLHSLGAPIPLANLLARTPPPLGALGKDIPHLGTALQMRALVARQHTMIREWLTKVDSIVAVCEWTRQVLLHNQVAPEKIFLSPHGFVEQKFGATHVTRPHQNGALRVVALGRLEPIKGVDLLVRALSQMPLENITLDIFGIEQDETETKFARRLRQEIAHDARIRSLSPVPHDKVIPLLRNYDVLAVPSQWLETGPLVVLEAFAAGIPVIGSNLGGIAEKIQDGVNGLLVSPLHVGAWRDALRRLAQDRTLLERMRAQVRPLRSMDEVAREHIALYERVRTKFEMGAS